MLFLVINYLVMYMIPFIGMLTYRSLIKQGYILAVVMDI
jgi:hypothetical protein